MCDTLVSLTDDGVLFAKNSDRDPNESQALEWHAARTHEAGARLRCTWITIEQVQQTNAVMLSRPWWIWGAEMGANSHGVVIGNEAVFTRSGGLLRGGSEREPGLLGMDLLRLALERTTSAEAAVACIVSLLERHGQGGAASFEHRGFAYDNSFIVADAGGAYVLETAGRSHAVERVGGGGRSISNGLTIDGFAKAHSDPIRGRVASCEARRTRTQASAEAARDVLDMIEALRDHGDRTHPRYSAVNGALSAPCAHAGGYLSATQSTSSWVADLTGKATRAAALHWVTGTSAPCTSVFKPASVEDPLELGPVPANTFDERTLWWRHERLHRSVMRNPAALLGRYRRERDTTEAEWVRDPPGSAESFAAAGDLERDWLAKVSEAVTAGAAPECRPARVVRMWRSWDRAAQIPVVPALRS